jgi:hypothetical protein
MSRAFLLAVLGIALLIEGETQSYGTLQATLTRFIVASGACVALMSGQG